MRQIKNIEVSEKADRVIQQGESGFKYILLAFLAICWWCSADGSQATLETVVVHKYQVASVGNKPYGKAPCVESFIPFLTVGDCHD